MDTLPLPPRPNLAQYKKRAKGLVTAARSNDNDSIRRWATEWLKTLARLRGVTITPFVQGSFDSAVDTIEKRVREKAATSHGTGSAFTLADAQFFIARAHGFEDWSEFANHLEPDSRKKADSQEFESAVDAVVGGNLSSLESLLHEHPELIRAQSTRLHRATLLHYVAANGVEDFRQQTPPNAVAIAKFLLQSGAEVDALANTYGGGKAQTTMNLLVSSAHPAGAGLQVPLVETLLDFGAAINGLEDNASPLMTALAFGYLDAAKALSRRGARVDNVISAASLGRVDQVRSFVVDGIKVPSSLVAIPWLRLTNDPKVHLERALVSACAFGQLAVVQLLMDHGVDPAAKDNDGMTGLHWAAASGYLNIVRLLLQRGAPLEVKNGRGKTVLPSTLDFALQYADDSVYYAAVIETLIAGGADLGALSHLPTGIELIDEVLRRHGARPG